MVPKGEVPKGFVVLKEGETTIEFRDTLPKSTTGKILKRILQDEEGKK